MMSTEEGNTTQMSPANAASSSNGTKWGILAGGTMLVALPS
jgi:hypothetical protein